MQKRTQMMIWWWIGFVADRNGHRPSVGVDGQRLVLVLAPVLALADEAAELGEGHVTGVDDHLLVALAVEQQPPAALVRREVALWMDRRHQVGLVSYGPHPSTTRPVKQLDTTFATDVTHCRETRPRTVPTTYSGFKNFYRATLR